MQTSGRTRSFLVGKLVDKETDVPRVMRLHFAGDSCLCRVAGLQEERRFLDRSSLVLHLRGKKTRRTKEEVGRQHQGMDRPGVRQVPEGSGEQGKMERTGCKITCGAPATLAVKKLVMMIMMMKMMMMMVKRKPK